MLARYFEIEPRQYEAPQMATEEAISHFEGLFAAFSAGGRTIGH